MRSERDSANVWRAERAYELFSDLSQQPFADYLKPLVLLSLNTGARQGELFRMQWEDIDFDRKSMALVMRGKRKLHTRHIPLNREAYEVLIGWRDMRHHFASRYAHLAPEQKEKAVATLDSVS